MEDTKEIQEEKVTYTYAVAIKFESNGKPYTFGCETKGIHKGDYVVVETQQGIELGQADADAIETGKLGITMPTRPVLRLATARDKRDYEENLEENDIAFDICHREIKKLELPMDLLSARYTLDRSKVLFVYLAEQRVDFRELLKVLGSQLHCRIELRQIGERDKARMIGGIGPCGMECCCRRFKTHFDVISINMAKNQLLALNIDKLSGMCGKLMCCLKYEDDDYKEMTCGLPKMGSQVEYEGNIYRITGMNVMADEAKLENRENAIFITLEDLRTKAIPRKGVVMPAKKEEEPKPVQKTVVHAKKEEKPVVRKPKREDREKPVQNKEVRSFSRKNKESSNAEVRTFTRKNRQTDTAKNPNITVRTFGRKKTEEETK